MIRRSWIFVLCIISIATFAAYHQYSTRAAQVVFQPKSPLLSTQWTSQVSTTNPLPEYPRPQMTRSNWKSLNGQWQFARGSQGQVPPFGQNLSETVLVPYPIESALSGIKRHENYMWYRQIFTLPSSWIGQRIQLHFGAVNWQATVYVNGQNVGSHKGSYDAFSFDITDQLHSGSNELLVGVYAPIDSDGINEPIGKQRINPSGIYYTASSGIWQTVWLEPTPFAHITRLDMTPDVSGQTLKLTVQGTGIRGQTVRATASSRGIATGTATGQVGKTISISVPNPHLWSPDDPFLYDIQASLVSNSTTIDQVSGYFGMRTIGTKVINGVLRPVLNGQPVFQIGPLDQGFWPDGIYTAPTDDALKFDIQKIKDLGYNMIRKHMKIEPARWYYWADKLGILVWQDMPAKFGSSVFANQEFENELHEVINQHISSPSIIMWIVFNESWGQFDQARVTSEVKSWDPNRLVDNMSGVNCCGAVDSGNGDTIDDHIYIGPGSPTPSMTRFATLGEFGGLGLSVAGHLWSNKGQAYTMEPDATTLTNQYVGLIEQVEGLIASKGLSAAVYTQTTDVENEINGLLTYDRAVVKMDASRVKAANAALIAASDRQVRVPLNSYQSLQVTTAGSTDRFLRYSDSLGDIEVVNSGSDTLLKQDATFKIVPGLADASCDSFESRNNPGQYLRHSNYRIRKDPNDGSTLFKQDATFCAQPGLSGTGVSFRSYNYPDCYIRHTNMGVWISSNGGPHAWDNPNSFVQDASWNIAAPWEP